MQNLNCTVNITQNAPKHNFKRKILRLWDGAQNPFPDRSEDSRPLTSLPTCPAATGLHLLPTPLSGRTAAVLDAAYSYRRSSVVGLSVCLSVCHDREPCKNG